MAIPFIQAAFSSGELAPELWGRVDLAKFHVAASTLSNMFVNYKGGASSRAGTMFVGRMKQTPPTPPRIITFQFSIGQNYGLEFGQQYLRFFLNGGYVTANPTGVTAITQSSPGIVSAANVFANDDWVAFTGIGGMTQLNFGLFRITSVSGSSFALLDLDGNPVNTAAFPAYSGGGSVSRIYEIPTPYNAVDLPLLKWTQSADVMTLVHPNYPPQELQRFGPTDWVLSAAQIGPSIGGTTILTGNASGAGTTGYSYAVTAIDAITGQESIRSNAFNVNNAVDMTSTAGSVTITWAAVSGAVQYNIYRAPIAFGGIVPVGSTFGYVGTSFGNAFTDTNLVADFTRGPPLFRNPLAPGQILFVTMTAGGSGYTTAAAAIATGTGSGFVSSTVIVGGQVVAVSVLAAGTGYAPGDTLNISGDGSGAAGTLTIGPQTGTYPGVAAYFQQRRIYANSLNQPDTFWASQPGAFQNFDVGFPVSDTDAITATPWAEQVNGIQFMIPMPSGLVTLTGLEAWQIAGSGTFGTTSIQPITPANTQAQQQAFQGCSDRVPPIKINYDILYVNALGSVPRDLAYNFFVNIYTGTDISLLSSQLFAPHQIIQWAWAQDPWKIVWAIRDDGFLLSLTYLKEQELLAWAHHVTQGSFISVCSISEPPVNAPYFVVERFGHFYLERMDNRLWTSLSNVWCVDSGLSYSGNPISVVSGLTHLIGASVTGLADGVQIPLTQVNGMGQITLPFAASEIVVGLPFTAQVQTVYLDDGQPTIQGRRKDIFRVTARVVASRDLQAGTNQPDGSAQSPPVLVTNWANMATVPNIGTPTVILPGVSVAPLFTGDLIVTVPPDWQKPGQVAIQQVNPVPLNLTALQFEYLPGDIPEVGIEMAPAQQPRSQGLFGNGIR